MLTIRLALYIFYNTVQSKLVKATGWVFCVVPICGLAAFPIR